MIGGVRAGELTPGPCRLGVDQENPVSVLLAHLEDVQGGDAGRVVLQDAADVALHALQGAPCCAAIQHSEPATQLTGASGDERLPMAQALTGGQVRPSVCSGWKVKWDPLERAHRGSRSVPRQPPAMGRARPRWRPRCAGRPPAAAPPACRSAARPPSWSRRTAPSPRAPPVGGDGSLRQEGY